MSESLPFTKMQAVGNDFVVVDAAHWPAGVDWSAVSRALCDRKFGIGSDGLLLVEPSASADVRMRMFNPDGTEDMCGNGLRCVVRYAIDHGIAPATAGTAESIDGVHAYRFAGATIEVEMAAPKFDLADIPVDRDSFPARCRDKITFERIFVSRGGASILVDAVNTGSTHCVVWRDELPDDELFHFWSPLIETDRAFPERTSVMWAVVEAPDRIRLRVWERGAGETLGCGTGACAAAVLARKTGRLSAESIDVVSGGGTQHVRWSGEDGAPVLLAGPAVTVYSGFVPLEVANAKG